MVRMTSRLAALFVSFSWIASGACAAPAADEPAPAPATKPAAGTSPSQEELEKEFAATLSGSALVGHFTDSDAAGKLPKAEKYTISKVSKLKGDVWLFQTRIQYGEHDLSLPLPLTVKWAGDTAVITLTDFAVPPLGKFTARVLIYRGQYAGTWSGGDHGGHLFGKIERAEVDKPQADKPDPDKTNAEKAK